MLIFDEWIAPGNYGDITPDPGVVVAAVCGICGVEMVVERDRRGPRSYTQAISGGSSHFDHFRCPHYDIDWHQQMSGLRLAALSTYSRTIAEIYYGEASDIFATKKPTKKSYP